MGTGARSFELAAPVARQLATDAFRNALEEEDRRGHVATMPRAA
jgi:hypothetical protein